MTDEEVEAIVRRGQEVGWVYFISTGRRGPIKIGWAKDPAARLRNLQTGQAERLELYAVIPGTRHLEYDIHRRLRYARILGEWFNRGLALRLVKPVIEEQGLFLRAEVVKSRNSPEIPIRWRVPKQAFIAVRSGG